MNQYLNRSKSQNEPYLVERTTGYFEYQLPVSVKGVLVTEGRVLLVGNPRGEWELPGGKLEVGETPESTVARELEEEVGLGVRVGGIVHSWVYRILPERHVFVVAYGVDLLHDSHVRLSVQIEEVGKADFFDVRDLKSLNMPMDYVRAIENWLSLLER